MKLLSSTKILIGFVVLCAALYYGYRIYTVRAIADAHFHPVKPGNVNLVGIDPGSGYQILVANQMAQLVEVEGGFQNSEGTGESGATSGSIKKRIPISEMLGVLRGDSKELGEFVMIMNDMTENDNWPTTRIVWRAEDLQKALNGDAVLLKKLEQDLNIKLDGTPLPTLRPSSLSNGIIIDYPVALQVNIEGQMKDVVGRVQQPYKPKLMRAIEEQLADKQVTPTMMAGYYATEAKKDLDDASRRENVGKNIEAVIAKTHAAQLREAPETVLKNAEVVINEHQVDGASYTSYDSGDKRSHDLTVHLTDEGQKRLWKYSMDRVGSHLLLIVDGVAVAAPVIQHELTENELTIRRMKDEVLVREAVDALNKAKTVAHS
jgi:hypothetical protein